MESINIVSPCGMLGYGFPKESFMKAFETEVHGIVVDAGSTDGGPHKLGAGQAIVSDTAVRKDLDIMISVGIDKSIPIIIGSAGGSGTEATVNRTLEIIKDVLKTRNLKAKIAVIAKDFDKDDVIDALENNKITPLTRNIHKLTKELIEETTTIVGQMGHEKIVDALEEGADIIVCGRAYDPSPFAAVGIYHGMDPGLSYHLGKILECGALCAEPGTTKDSILGKIYKNSFTLESLNPIRKCTTTSVAAHTFYEKEHPYLLDGPGMTLDLSECTFTELEPGVIEVKNSKFIPKEKYTIKLEGARKVSYRTFVIAGVRDPMLIDKLETVQAEIAKEVENHYSEIPSDRYSINFYNYGKNAVLGDREPEVFSGHEIGVLFEVLADTQELADTICASLRSTFLHYGYQDRKATSGNLAFPFAPSDISFGPVYEFSVYHLLEIEEIPFSIEWMEVSNNG